MVVHAPRRRPGSPEADDRGSSRFESLYRQWYQPVVRLCRRRLGGHRDVEAVAQDAFLRAWASWDSFGDGRPFGPWVMTIAHRLCVNEHVTQARHRGGYTDLVGVTRLRHRAADDEIDQAIRSETVARALASLSARDRRLVRLRDLDGWSYGDIARFEGVTVESVRGSLKRARAAFRNVYTALTETALGGFAVLRWNADRWFGPFVGRFGSTDVVSWIAALALLVGSAPTGASTRAKPPEGSTEVAAPFAVPLVDMTTDEAPPAPVVHSTRTGSPGGGLSPSRTPADGPQPDIGWSYEFTASPSYDDERTVFAAGSNRGCVLVGCAVLFRSTDGGTTWTHLPATGRDVGRILLPPSYPKDDRIFSASAHTLSVSKDGGRTFQPLTAVPGPAAISPLFSAGDPRILFAPAPHNVPVAVEYDDDARTAKPVRVALPLNAVPATFAFSPSYANDRRLLVPVVEVQRDLASRTVGDAVAVYSCAPAACERVLDLGHGHAPPLVLWGAGTRGLAWAWNAHSLYRSTDEGRSWSALDIPGSHPWRVIAGLSTASNGRLFVTIDVPGGDELYVSTDRGTTWELLDTGDDSFAGLTALGDGTLLASPLSGDDRGIRCSVDGGRTWAGRCERPDA